MTSSKKDKHAPQELTSKQPVSVVRQLPSLPRINRPKFSDPRFDRSMGHYNPDLFKKTYAFVDDLQAKELSLVKAEASNKELSEDRRAQLNKLLDRAKSKQKQLQKDKRRKELIKEWKKTEHELVKSGHKQPYYLKKTDVRKLELIDEYNTLKKRNPNVDMDRVLEKKRKRKASKQHPNMPMPRISK